MYILDSIIKENWISDISFNWLLIIHNVEFLMISSDQWYKI